MDGKRLYFSTKMCDPTCCSNYHSILVGKIETSIMALFDISALSNGIIPKPTTLLEATHIQYIDINGTIHIRPFGMVVEPLSDIVNFRLLRSSELFTCYPSLETSLEPIIDIYRVHLQKLCFR